MTPLKSTALALAFGLVLSGPALAQVTDYLGLPGPIVVGTESFELAWSSQPQDNYIKHEYVPAGQTVERFEEMVMVETLIAPITPADAMAAQVGTLNQTRANDPVFNMAVMQNEASGETMLDFVLSEQDAQGNYTIEWSAYRYAPYQNAAGETGIMLFAISHRAYGNEDSQSFLQNLGALRTEQMDALAAAPLPQPQS